MTTFIAIMLMIALCVFICLGIAKMWYNTDLAIIKKDYDDKIYNIKLNHELDKKRLLREIRKNLELINALEQRLLREQERQSKD